MAQSSTTTISGKYGGLKTPTKPLKGLQGVLAQFIMFNDKKCSVCFRVETELQSLRCKSMHVVAFWNSQLSVIWIFWFTGRCLAKMVTYLHSTVPEEVFD
jgi:hypothetical protein